MEEVPLENQEVLRASGLKPKSPETWALGFSFRSKNMVSNETPTTIGKTMKTNDIKNIVSIVSTVITTGLTIRTHIKSTSTAKDTGTKTNKLNKVAVDRAKKVIETRFKNGEFQNSNEADVREALLTEIEFQKITLQYEEA